MLETVFDEEKTQSIIDVMPDEMIVWKVVTDWRYAAGTCISKDYGFAEGVWHTAFMQNFKWGVYRPGFNIDSIDIGYHSLVSQKDLDCYRVSWVAERKRTKAWVSISAKINKEWIKRIGYDKNSSLTIVASKIIMPTYPNTDITKEIDTKSEFIEDHEESMALMQK